MSFIVYPAIDLRGGKVVRLHQGDYNREQQYAQDPFALAMTYADAGAQWLHLVDLDAAREGGYALDGLLRQIAADGRLQVQTGGGVRIHADVQARFDSGAARVVIGSLAATQPAAVESWIEAFGESLVVALDVRQDEAGIWWPWTHGWTQRAAMPLDALIERFSNAGLVHLLCTDISRDGTMAGPNFDLYGALRSQVPAMALQASGGARSLQDVAQARACGCAGIVLGKSLLDGRFALAEALAC